MKFVILLALLGLFAVASAHYETRDNLVKWNRTPKLASIFTDSCDECQLIIKRIAEIAKDPTKIGELKMLLSMLCKETSYEDECRLFVANIDKFLKELAPYLKDPHAVCQKLHICGNKKLEQFHRVGMLYAKKYLNQIDGARDLVCEECQFAANELKNVIEDRQTQHEVKQFLSENVCGHLGQYRGICDQALDSFMPDFWTELEEILSNPKQVATYVRALIFMHLNWRYFCLAPSEGDSYF
ncbi:saposin-like type b, region 1 domain-containing protein [Ditylenchus destructor]|nr:saposin-like type b, region 1 domain-containing protein [Ditylenchus destructor]